MKKTITLLAAVAFFCGLGILVPDEHDNAPEPFLRFLRYEYGPHKGKIRTIGPRGIKKGIYLEWKEGRLWVTDDIVNGNWVLGPFSGLGTGDRNDEIRSAFISGDSMFFRLVDESILPNEFGVLPSGEKGLKFNWEY